jgi:hypothetical protein
MFRKVILDRLKDDGSFFGHSFYPEWAGGRASSFGAGTKQLLRR